MSTKTKTQIKKLPAGLPPLPPVPAGYDDWEYMGLNWGCTDPVGVPYGVCRGKDDSNWFDCIVTKELGRADKPLFAGHYCHIIRAIKHPAPKPAAKGRKAVKARRMWAGANDFITVQAWLNEKKIPTHQIPVALLDISDEAALIEQAMEAIRTERMGSMNPELETARAVLESLGLIAKRRK